MKKRKAQNYKITKIENSKKTKNTHAHSLTHTLTHTHTHTHTHKLGPFA